jgi:ABC-type nitrate/sulfonate/bicarbonate transport system substrate-binding protein
VTFVNVSAATTQVDAALKNHQVDAAFTFPTGTQFLQDSGTAVELMYVPDSDSALSDIHFAAWAGTPEWVDANKEAVEAFCAAVESSSQFIHDEANADTVVPIIVEDMGVSESVAQRVLDDGVYDTYTTELTQEDWDRTVQTLIDAGVVKSDPIPTYDELFASAS